MVAGPYTLPTGALPLTWADHRSVPRSTAGGDIRATRITHVRISGTPGERMLTDPHRRGDDARYTTAGGRLRQTTGDVSTRAKQSASSSRSARAGAAHAVAQ
ncbi:hypothetical protein EV188_102788 [Actinomycetospora succinea]|uniref:Uncharacterized protein n=1 Tax=Actinomycetospora succinea TaxID=663603 RepID=A0A4R6VMF5_9PSEU|nr:hypothetical protein EV188_102788 [Actinomycetospora succinea]